MITSKKIGRMTLLKHCLISAGMILSIPVLAELIQSKSINIIRAIQEAFKIRSFDIVDIAFLLIHLTILLIGIWAFGGRAGRLIIDKEKPKFLVAFMAIFKLWILHFISATILQILRNGPPMIGLFIGGFFLIMIVGVAHGLVDGHFISREIERKGRNSKETKTLSEK